MTAELLQWALARMEPATPGGAPRWAQGQARRANDAVCPEYAVGLAAVALGADDQAFLAAYRLLGVMAGRRMAVWNDAPCRTFAEVRALLQAAIAVAREPVGVAP